MFREHLTCSFSLRFIMVMFYPPHCYICCHDCIQLWRFRMQPLTPWLEALRPGWFVDSHGCLESELFDLDSAPADPMGTNSVSFVKIQVKVWFKDKIKPHFGLQGQQNQKRFHLELLCRKSLNPRFEDFPCSFFVPHCAAKITEFRTL